MNNEDRILALVPRIMWYYRWERRLPFLPFLSKRRRQLQEEVSRFYRST